MTEDMEVEVSAPVAFNLGNIKGRVGAAAAVSVEEARINEDRMEAHSEGRVGSLLRYITSGIRELSLRDVFLLDLYGEDTRYFVKDGIFYPSFYGYHDASLMDFLSSNEIFRKKAKSAFAHDPEAVELPIRLDANANGAVVTLLLNGDEDANTLVDECVPYKFPTVSFRCLGRFYLDRPTGSTPTQTLNDERKGINLALQAIAEGQLRVVDFTPDDYLPMSEEDKKKIMAYEKYRTAVGYGDKVKKAVEPPTPPERGYTAVGHSWHRSATVLFYDKVKRMTLILGQDENSYFGCELSGTPKTVQDAYTALVPKDLRDKGELLRQGEWFFVPIDEDEVPKIEEAILHTQDFQLKVEHPDSNMHVVTCEDGRMSAKGVMYAFNPSMEHDEHETVAARGWYAFRCNTAKRSFSEGGVD